MNEVGVEPAFVAVVARAEPSPARRVARALALPFTAVSWVLVRIALGALAVYKKVVSPLLPPLCRFEPTCSQYFAEALVKKGLIRGSLLGIYRLLRCQPLCKGGYDPVD